MAKRLRPAIQLYSVRELPGSLADIVHRVGEAGFEGVEFANRFEEEDIDEIATALEDADVEPAAVHADLSDVEAAIDGNNDLLERCDVVGCDRIVIPHLSPRHFRTQVATRDLSHRLRDVASELDTVDIDLGYHTIRYDLWPMFPDQVEPLMDVTPFEILLNNLARGRSLLRRNGTGEIPSRTGFWNLLAQTMPEELFYELEVGEVIAAGFEPSRAFELATDRVQMIHLRDVAPTGRFGTYEDVPHGDGVVNFENVIESAREAEVEWVVFEDELDRDPETKIEEGATLLTNLLRTEETLSRSGTTPASGN